MSNYLRAFALATSVAALSLSAHADVIINVDFEALASSAPSTGVAVGNTYIGQGLTFSADARAYRNDGTAGTYNVTNPPQPASGVGFVRNVLPATTFTISVLNTFDYNANSLTFDGAVSKAGFTVTAFDRNGDSTSLTVPAFSTSNTWAWMTGQVLDLASLGSLDHIDFSSQGSSTTGLFAIDNLKFSLVASPYPKNVPEPAGLALVAAALAGVALSAKRRKQA